MLKNGLKTGKHPYKQTLMSKLKQKILTEYGETKAITLQTTTILKSKLMNMGWTNIR